MHCQAYSLRIMIYDQRWRSIEAGLDRRRNEEKGITSKMHRDDQ